MKNNIVKAALSFALILISTLAFSQQKQERDVAEFSGVSLGIQADLFLTQGSPHKVVIEADENDLDDIETVVKDGVLRIQTKKSWSINNLKNVKVWVSTPDINVIKLSGSGEILAETAIKTTQLEIGVSGSGNIKLSKLSAEEIKSGISGSGDIYLGGEAEELSLGISGSGSMKAADLIVEEANIRISGSGGCQVDATGELDVSISGSGRVTYYSNPQVDASISGSGRVKNGEK